MIFLIIKKIHGNKISIYQIMAIVKKSLPSVLSPEDKKYLRAYSRYLNANGLKDANIEVDFDYENDLSDIRWDDIDSLSNNYRVEVFPELIQIIKKISSFCDENVFEKEKDDTSYEQIGRAHV